MAEPYLCEIRIFGFRFAPKGWAFCDGQLLAIADHMNLYQLIGTQYGGDGTTTFALPNLQSRLAVQTDSYAFATATPQFPVGTNFGSTEANVSDAQMPSHDHAMLGDGSGFDTALASPSGGLPARTSPVNPIYANANSTPVTMSPLMISVTGDNISHNNVMPYLVLNYCFAIQGVYPTRA